MLEIKCSGSPRQVGFQHGSTAKKQVAGSIAFYAALFKRTCSLDWDLVHTKAVEFVPSLEKLCPRYVEEMRGLAEGAGVDFLDIVALNVRSEINFGLFTEDANRPIESDGCTSLACRGTAGGVFLAQNWDWEVDQAANLVICHVSQPDRPTITMITEAGVIGKIGFNSNGVGTCLNAIRARGIDMLRLPIHLALRMALETSSAREASEAIQKIGIAASAHILVADAMEAISLESTSQSVVALRMESKSNSPIVHTNHLILDHPHDVDEPAWLLDTGARLTRMRHLLQQRATSAVSAEDETESLYRLFQDEDGYPGAINRCQAGKSGAETLFTIIMDLGRKQAQVTFGRPNQGAKRWSFSF